MAKTTEEQARELAIEAARNDPEQHEYTHNARAQAPWEPHRWVVNAITKALQRMSAGTDRLERAEAAIRELHGEHKALERRHVAVVDSVTERLRKLEAALLNGDLRVIKTLEHEANLTLRSHSDRIGALETRMAKAEDDPDRMVAGLGAALKRPWAPAVNIVREPHHRPLFPRIGSKITEENRPPDTVLVNGKPRKVNHHGGGNYSIQLSAEDCSGDRVVLAPDVLAPDDPTREYAKAPAFVHPDHMTTITENAADSGDPMAMGLMALTKERDTYRGQMHRLGRWMDNHGPIVGREHRRVRGPGANSIVDAAIATMVDLGTLANTLARVTKHRDELAREVAGLREEFDTLHDGVRQTLDRNGCDAPTSTNGIMAVLRDVFADRQTRARERDAAEERYRKQLEVTNALRADAEQYIAERNRLTVELQSAKESAQRAHDDSAQVRQALATATKERDNAYRAADKAKAQRDGVRSTVVDQARQLEELRQGQRDACDSIADLQRDHAEHVSALTDRTNAEIERLTADNQRLRMQTAEMWSKDQREAAHSELADLREQLAMVDADRVPLRMDLDEAKAIAAITAPLVKVTQQWCNAWLHDGYRETIDRPMSSAMVANTCELVGAHETFEKAMAEHLASIPF